MIADAESILKVCGLGSYLHIGCGRQTLVFELLKRSADAYGLDSDAAIISDNQGMAPGRFFQGELANYPFEAESFDHIIIGDALFNYNLDQIGVLIPALRLMVRKTIILQFSQETMRRFQGNLHRHQWEQIFLKAGFRKHPGAMAGQSREEFASQQLMPFSFFERMSDLAFNQYQEPILQTHARPYIDHLRHAGQMPDNILSRYNLAASKICSGDVVIDLGCQTGCGASVLAASGKASKIIGIDSDEDIVAYAKMNYEQPNLFFHHSDLCNLVDIPSHSIDMIVAFDVICKFDDQYALLNEIRRVLKPNGKLIGSLPCSWKDMSGMTLNRHHKSYQWKDIQALLSSDFIIEDRLVASASSQYLQIAVNQFIDYQPDWWIFSSFIDPRKCSDVSYVHNMEGHSIPNHINFGGFYDNPWLYRVMVQLGERITDKEVLSQFCIDVANNARSGSADQGAALCVLSYQMLESGKVSEEALIKLVNKINQFDEDFDENNVHAYRWAVSLHYVGARLLLSIGRREEALAAFKVCSEMNVLNFSPLLATKTISSHMYAGLLFSSIQDIESAKHHFKLAVREAHRVLQNDWMNIIGDFESPLSFGLPETAEIIDIASQCVAAMSALESHPELPGYLWSKINIKRFGLVEWNHSLERENDKLRKQLEVA